MLSGGIDLIRRKNLNFHGVPEDNAIVGRLAHVS